VIRRIERGDRKRYVELVKAFYSSPAVLESVPEENILATFEEMMRSRDYVQGFFLLADNGQVAGYALVVKSFSQEAGGMVLWVDELYILKEYRSLGLGGKFLDFLQENLAEDVKRIRLEVEEDNSRAMSLYQRLGFEELPYVQMIMEP
jgi:ribosomal protein S18 acetylase RimI-like enzyme